MEAVTWATVLALTLYVPSLLSVKSLLPSPSVEKSPLAWLASVAPPSTFWVMVTSTVSPKSASAIVTPENSVLVDLSPIASTAAPLIVGALLTEVTVITVVLSVTAVAVPSSTEISNVVTTVEPTATWFSVGVNTMAWIEAIASAGVTPVTVYTPLAWAKSLTPSPSVVKLPLACVVSVAPPSSFCVMATVSVSAASWSAIVTAENNVLVASSSIPAVAAPEIVGGSLISFRFTVMVAESVNVPAPLSATCTVRLKVEVVSKSSCATSATEITAVELLMLKAVLPVPPVML